ncbi:MAG: Gfo/Idh/MocA family oxidoreductase [Acetobacteraceae bacterium]|nr:Gfo/Idh/MocA family oxidoreductase [Acetobacteraceae bacterium]
MSVRVGIVGVGVMGGDHARILHDGVAGADLVAVQDADSERARRVARDCDAGRVFDTASQLIADPAVDAVIVASPDETHASLVIACLEQGKPVLCEKPLADTLERCLAVIAAEVRSGRRLVQVGYMRRFDPGYRAMKRSFADGTLGAPLFLHCVHRNAVAPHYMTSELVIANSAVHDIDAARYLLDDDFVAVTVISPRATSNAPSRQPQFTVLETRRGTLVDIESFLDAQYGYDVRAELVCEGGAVSLAPNPPIAVRQGGRDGFGLNPDWRGRFEDAYREQLRAWVASIGTGKPTGSSAWDGYVASATAAACLDALRSKARVPVDLRPRPDFYG